MTQEEAFPNIAATLGGYPIFIPGSVASRSTTVVDLVNKFGPEATVTISDQFEEHEVDLIQKLMNDLDTVTEESFNITKYDNVNGSDLYTAANFFDFIGNDCAYMFMSHIAGNLIFKGDFSNFEFLYDVIRKAMLMSVEDCVFKPMTDGEFKSLVLNSIFHYTDFRNTISNMITDGTLTIDHNREDRCSLLECLTSNYFENHVTDEERAYFSEIIRCDDIRECDWADRLLMKEVNLPHFNKDFPKFYPMLANLDWTNICLEIWNINNVYQDGVVLHLYGLEFGSDSFFDKIDRVKTRLAKNGYSNIKASDTVITISSGIHLDNLRIHLIADGSKSLYSVADKLANVRNQVLYNGIAVITTYPCILASTDKKKDYVINIGKMIYTTDTLIPWKSGSSKRYSDLIIVKGSSYSLASFLSERGSCPEDTSVRKIVRIDGRGIQIVEDIQTGIILSYVTQSDEVERIPKVTNQSPRLTHDRYVTVTILTPGKKLVKRKFINIASSNLDFLTLKSREGVLRFNDVESYLRVGDIVDFYPITGNGRDIPYDEANILINRSFYGKPR